MVFAPDRSAATKKMSAALAETQVGSLPRASQLLTCLLQCVSSGMLVKSKTVYLVCYLDDTGVAAVACHPKQPNMQCLHTTCFMPCGAAHDPKLAV